MQDATPPIPPYPLTPTVHELIVPRADGEPERIDAFITRALGHLTRAAVQRLMEAGLITVGGKPAKSSQKVVGGEKIRVQVPAPVKAAPEAEEIPLEILHEDSDLIVINKPRGMSVHPGAGNSGGTLVNALLAHCQDLSGIGGELRPGIVHRLDKDTTGVLVVAKNDRSHEELSRQFRAHSIKRVYLALVYGTFATDRGRIEGAIGRHPTDRKKMSGRARHGKEAVTHWRILERFAGITLLQLRLETGRTHQIRVHLSESGHPLLGDQVYGGTARETSLKDAQLKSLVRQLGRQALHARTLGFIHPTTGSYLEFSSPLPLDMERIIHQLQGESSPPPSSHEPE